jgi:hypothetical protein
VIHIKNKGFIVQGYPSLHQQLKAKAGVIAWVSVSVNDEPQYKK